MRAALIPWDAHRALSPRRGLVWGTFAVLAAALIAAIERSSEEPGAPDRSLAFVLGVLVPLLGVAAVLRLADEGNLRQLGASAARYGTNRRSGVLRSLLAVALGLTIAACSSAWVALLVSRGPSDPRLLADLLATTPIAAGAAFAYVAWMAVGATFGDRGGGVLIALLADWLAGATSLPVAWGTPRGHVRHLLGLEAAFGFSPWISFAALASLTAVGAALVALRVPR